MPTEPTREQIDLFIKEYGELREKHKLDFISIPQFTPSETGTWELRVVPQIVSTEQPVPSPFMAS